MEAEELNHQQLQCVQHRSAVSGKLLVVEPRRTRWRVRKKRRARGRGATLSRRRN